MSHPSPSPPATTTTTTPPPPIPSPSPLPPEDPPSSSPSSHPLHPPPATTTTTTRSPTPTPHFIPFFTLLTTHSPQTGASSTYHPTVTYTFASDAPDTSPITAAALRSLCPPQSGSATTPSSPTNPSTVERGREERYILLDMDATGTRVVSAQSMAPGWAVVGTEVGAAPHWEGEGAGGAAAVGSGNGRDRDGDRGLMLKIEGVEAPSPVGSGDGGKKGLEQLMEEYESGMRELRRVVEANGDSDTVDEEGEPVGEREGGGEG